MTPQEEISVEDELWQIEDKTRSDGTVQGEILGWEKVDHYSTPMVRIRIRLPNGQRFESRLPWPASADPDEYEFVRLVEYCGYSLTSASKIAGAEVPCRREDGRWTLHLPQSTRSQVREHGMGLLRVILAPVTMLWYFPRVVREDGHHNDAVGYAIGTAMLLSAWLVAILLGYVIVTGLAALVGAVV